MDPKSETLEAIVEEATEEVVEEASEAAEAADQAAEAAVIAESAAAEAIAEAEDAEVLARLEAAQDAASYIEGNEAWRQETTTRLTTLETRSATAEELLLSIRQQLMPQPVTETVPEAIPDLDSSRTEHPVSEEPTVPEEAVPAAPPAQGRRRHRWI